MGKALRWTTLAAGLAALAWSLSGCIEAAVVTAGAAGTAIADERSMGRVIDDHTLAVNVNSAMLKADEKLFVAADVTVRDGRVQLTGRVPNPDARVEAARIAWTVEGVREVLNELVVTDRSGWQDYPRDARITTEIVTRMLFDKDVSQINFTIETVNATVYVMGVARSEAERDKVNNIARSIGGVRRVVNNALLRDDPRRK
ncbi:MAG: BON domain-containing protein [Alphaproteobacteria bacterium]|nr:BON domain-containing protein [Alphaproteobacteria bacterium]